LGAFADHVVIGAGGTGCVLANRLREDGGAPVCLLEVGGDDRPGRSPRQFRAAALPHIPMGFAEVIKTLPIVAMRNIRNTDGRMAWRRAAIFRKAFRPFVAFYRDTSIFDELKTGRWSGAVCDGSEGQY